DATVEVRTGELRIDGAIGIKAGEVVARFAIGIVEVLTHQQFAIGLGWHGIDAVVGEPAWNETRLGGIARGEQHESLARLPVHGTEIAGEPDHAIAAYNNGSAL